MKKVLLIIGLCLAIIVGWFSLIKDTGSQVAGYLTDIAQADEWMDRGLYQRAINKYKEAIEYQDTIENWNKLCNAYELRMEEDTGIYSDYLQSIEDAIHAHPSEEQYYLKAVRLLIENEDYEEAYKWLRKAEKNHVKSEEIDELMLQVKYSHDIEVESYIAFTGEANGAYAVSRGHKWRTITSTGETIFDKEYLYQSQPGENGVTVITTEEGSWLVDGEEMILGIFEEPVTEAGVYGEGVIPIQRGDVYDYYDSFADRQFGGFEQAGTFYNGMAAVSKNGKWYVIDASGEKISEEFVDIKFDKGGRFNSQDIILAAKKAGEYCMYDTEWNVIGDFRCEAIDICTKDGVIAFQKGNKWGFADAEGNVVIEPQYEEAKSFSNGLAAVKENGCWGFVNRDNILVIKNEFLNADYFNEAGRCMVSTLEKSIDEEGIEDSTEELTEEAVKEYWQVLVLELGIK